MNRGILVGASPCVNFPCSRTLLPVSILHEGSSNPWQTLVDSGAEGNFLDSSVAKQWNIPAIPLSWSLAGQLNSTITHSNPRVSLIFSGNHREGIELHLLNLQFWGTRGWYSTTLTWIGLLAVL